MNVDSDSNFLRIITDQCPAGLVVIDSQGTIVLANQRVVDWFGYGTDELTGNRLEILVPESMRGSHERHRERYHKRPESRAMSAGRTLQGQTKSGELFEVEVDLRPLVMADKNYVLASITNLEAHRQSEQVELHNRSARFTGIVDNVVEGIITIDEQGVIESVNPAAERIFGYTQEELVGMNIRSLMPEPYSSEHDHYLKNYRSTGIRKIIGIGREAYGRKKDGSVFPIDLSVGEVKLHDRRVFTGVIRDITNRKRIENELRRQRDFAKRLIATTQAIVLVLEPDGTVQRFNRFLEQMTGSSQAEVEGCNWVSQFIPESARDEFGEVFAKSLESEAVHETFSQLIAADGSIRDIAWWIRGLDEAEGGNRQILCVGHDFTELKQAQERALHAERLAAIGQMVTGLAHESRNAIQRAQACQEMLALDVEEQPELLDLIQRTQRALDDLHRLYEEVRGYAAPVSLQCEQVNLRELWELSWKDLEIVRKGRQITLVEECAEMELYCEVDAHRIHQVLRNVFENAIAASPEGSEIRIRCTETNLDSTPAIRIAIQDQGPGVSTEIAAQVFEPFFTTKKKGTGLGMAIAKRLAEAHGGRIEISNPDQLGAEVVLTLPRSLT